MRTHSLTALALGALLVVAAPAAADTRLVLESHQDGFTVQGREQPSRDSTVEVWIGDGRIRRDDGRIAAVLTGDRLLLIYLEDSAYSTLDLPFDLAPLLPEEVRRQAGMWRMEAEVRPLEETREIAGLSASGYDVTLSNPAGLAVASTLWLTQDLDVDYAAFQKMSRAMASLQPGGGDGLDPLFALQGFPVLMETAADLQGVTVRTSERLVSVEKQEPPAGLYAPPEGFTERPFDPLAGNPSGP